MNPVTPHTDMYVTHASHHGPTARRSWIAQLPRCVRWFSLYVTCAIVLAIMQARWPNDTEPALLAYPVVIIALAASWMTVITLVHGLWRTVRGWNNRS